VTRRRMCFICALWQFCKFKLHYVAKTRAAVLLGVLWLSEGQILVSFQ